MNEWIAKKEKKQPPPNFHLQKVVKDILYPEHFL